MIKLISFSFLVLFFIVITSFNFGLFYESHVFKNDFINYSLKQLSSFLEKLTGFFDSIKVFTQLYQWNMQNEVIFILMPLYFENKF